MPNKIVYNNNYCGFSISQEAINHIEKYCEKHGIDSPLVTCKQYANIPRHHPALVDAVEKLGIKANNNNSHLEKSDLRIFETSSNKYWIENYDGMETVHTAESIEWVTIEK